MDLKEISKIIASENYVAKDLKQNLLNFLEAYMGEESDVTNCMVMGSTKHLLMIRLTDEMYTYGAYGSTSMKYRYTCVLAYRENDGAIKIKHWDEQPDADEE